MVRKRAFSLVGLVAAAAVLLAATHHDSVAAESSTTQGTGEPVVRDPIIYKRLRFDEYYLQVYRRFQKYLAVDEKRVTVKLNVTSRSKVEELTFNYFQNDQVEATNFTYDDLVFEALDRAFHTRLWPVFVQNYDNKNDLARASDPAKLDAARCEREMNFLMRSLEPIKRARADETSKTGIRASNSLSPELLAFFDAFANEEAGLLLGNFHWTGQNWRECNKRLVFNVDQRRPENSVEFHGRFCTASLRSSNWAPKIDERVAELEARHFFRTNEQRNNYKRFFRLQLGLCLPESCDSRLLSERPGDIHKLATFKLRAPLTSYDLVDLYCLPDETGELRKVEPAGRLLLCLAALWLAVIVAATVLDYNERRASVAGTRAPEKGAHQAGAAAPQLSWRHMLIAAFSLFKTYERFMETKSCQPSPTLSEQVPSLEAALELETATTGSSTRASNESNGHGPATTPAPPAVVLPKLVPGDLLFLNALKTFMMPLIIFGHVGMQWKQMDKFPNDYNAASTHLVHTHVNGIFVVDWYFVISSFITTYIMFITRKVARNSLRDWIYSIVHRYWRLAPIYLLVFWFAQSLFMHLNAGPMWDYGTSNMTFRSICRAESWLGPLTLTSNWYPIPNNCIMTGWYVSMDMQFAMLAPFFIVLLYKSPALGWLVACGTIALSVALRFQRYMTDPRAQPLELMRPRYDMYARNNGDMYPTYIFTHYRLPSTIFGILAAHYTYMVLSGQWRSSIYVNPSALVAANGGTSRGGRKKTASQLASIIKRAQTRRTILWFTGFVSMNAVFWSTWIVSTVFPVAWEPHVKPFTASVYSLHHSISSAAMSLFLVTMMLGQFELLKKVLSLPIWSIMSRINYPLLLTHVEVINYYVQSSDKPTELNDNEYYRMLVFVLAVVYPICTTMHLTLELPLVQLERYFLHPLFYAKKPTPSSGSLQNNHRPKDVDTK